MTTKLKQLSKIAYHYFNNVKMNDLSQCTDRIDFSMVYVLSWLLREKLWLAHHICLVSHSAKGATILYSPENVLFEHGCEMFGPYVQCIKCHNVCVLHFLMYLSKHLRQLLNLTCIPVFWLHYIKASCFSLLSYLQFTHHTANILTT